MDGNETVNQVDALNGSGETTPKTFTQLEVNSIVEDRLKRERSKYTDYDSLKEKADKLDKLEEESKSELQKATERATSLEKQLNDMKAKENVRAIRDKVAEETKVPVTLLTADTEEGCKAQAEAIKAFVQTQTDYPSVQDGGEVTNNGKRSTRDQFADWAAKNLV